MNELTGLYGAPLEGCATLLSRCASYQKLVGTKSESEARATIFLIATPADNLPKVRSLVNLPDNNVHVLTDTQITSKIEFGIEKRYDDPTLRANVVEFSNLASAIVRELFASTDQYLEISSTPCGSDLTIIDDKVMTQRFIISGSFS